MNAGSDAGAGRPRFRTLVAGDVDSVTRLLRGGSGPRCTPDYYRWKLCRRATPVANVALAVDRAGRPVFHLAGIPRRCVIAGVERWSMVAVDAFTLPSFRRQGLLTEGAGDLFARWREAGVALIFGLPNEQWGSRSRALGWEPVGRLAWLILPLAPGALLARRLGWSGLARIRLPAWWWRHRWRVRARDAGWSLAEIDDRPPTFDETWRDTSGGTGCRLIRDQDWVTWRYRQGPEPRYTVLLVGRGTGARGYVAWRVVETGGVRTGVIAEVSVAGDEPGATRVLLAGALQRLASDRVETVRLLAGPGSYLRRAARTLGFLPTPYGFPLECVRLDPGVSLAAVRSGVGSMAGGDFDVV